MAEFNLYPTLLVLLLSHLSLSSAQLIGTLSRCDHDPNLITAVITNTHTRHVSVLKHNTIFDTSHLSVPFRISNLVGIHLPMGSSHLFYTGVNRNDFLDLAPGENFTRHLNLTEYVTLESEGSKRLQTIQISLPSAFQGLKDHDGGYDIHPAAKGQLKDGQLQLGDVSKANLTFISHTSVPFQTAISVPTRHSRLKTRQDGPRGVALIEDTCTPADTAKVSMSVQHAGFLAGAGINAAARFGELPFNYFFPGQLQTAQKVVAVLNRVVGAVSHHGPLIQITCKDVFHHCINNDHRVVTGYAAQRPDRHPMIVLCPSGLTLPPNPPPCSARPGTFSLGYLTLHEMVHIKSISGLRLDIYDTTGQRALDVHNAVRAGRDTTTDANAYAFLGTWSWDLGFGGSRKVCLDRFSTGQFAVHPFSG